jgi:hypothetical protein
MMDSLRLTLKELFSDGGPGPVIIPREEIEAAAPVARMKEVLREKVPALRWRTTRAEILEKLDALLDVDLATVMARAWKKYTELLRYADPEKCPADRVYLVPLAEHVIRSEHRPSLEILLNGEKVGEIEFRLEVSLALKGIILKIQGGRIKAVHTGECRWTGTVRCEDLILAEGKGASFALPGVIDLGEGIPIC